MSETIVQTTWKIGDLAKQAGLSIRTLHYYDEIGLLTPSARSQLRCGSARSQAGHRLYAEADIIRLQQIVSLRQLGFSLEEIKACLENSDFSPVAILQSHAAKLREQIQLQQKLAKLLESISARLQNAQGVSTQDFIEAIEGTKMVEELFDKYYTPQQRQYLDERYQQIGEDAIAQVQQEWQDLFAAVREEMERGTDPTAESVLALARRWTELIAAFTGGDSGIEQSLSAMVQTEYATMQQQFDFPDRALFEYIGQAQAALNPE